MFEAVMLLFETIATPKLMVVSATVMIFEARLMSKSTHELVSDMHIFLCTVAAPSGKLGNRNTHKK